MQERYREPEKLSSVTTEWHRISASRRDPTDIGTDGDGRPINLIADGVYDRGRTVCWADRGLTAGYGD